jgi:hypothetical protein
MADPKVGHRRESNLRRPFRCVHGVHMKTSGGSSQVTFQVCHTKMSQGATTAIFGILVDVEREWRCQKSVTNVKVTCDDPSNVFIGSLWTHLKSRCKWIWRSTYKNESGSPLGDFRHFVILVDIEREWRSQKSATNVKITCDDPSNVFIGSLWTYLKSRCKWIWRSTYENESGSPLGDFHHFGWYRARMMVPKISHQRENNLRRPFECVHRVPMNTFEKSSQVTFTFDIQKWVREPTWPLSALGMTSRQWRSKKSRDSARIPRNYMNISVNYNRLLCNMQINIF